VSEIQVVGAEAYLAGLNLAHESEECLTHIAQLHHPTHGPLNTFVKYYFEDRGPQKGLINEVCGHILAHQAGLPVPPRPLIVLLPAERIAGMHPAYAARIGREQKAVWATERVSNATMLPHGEDEAAELLREWDSLPDLIAFDSWLVNADRSARNLLRRRNGQFVLIDHGHLAGGALWDADLMWPSQAFRHPFLRQLWDGQVPSKIKQGIMAAADRHADCFVAAEAEIKHWLDVLGVNSRDRIALLDFLKERAEHNPAHMKKILGLLV
jgi:hypothetical protein